MRSPYEDYTLLVEAGFWNDPRDPLMNVSPSCTQRSGISSKTTTVSGWRLSGRSPPGMTTPPRARSKPPRATDTEAPSAVSPAKEPAQSAHPTSTNGKLARPTSHLSDRPRSEPEIAYSAENKLRWDALET